ncbi:MAG: DUF4238 domain-containing protein [Ruminococcus sp.]|nr:DUF4238 domain-containing protein [Ruminococcus sp.]
MKNNSEKQNNTIDSHIQMPKFILRQFEINNRFYYYDVEGDYIGNHGNAKTTNTYPNYYSNSIEIALNKEIETPFSNFLKFVEKAINDGGVFQINDAQYDAAYNFIYALIARSPAILKIINNNSLFFQFMSEKDQHDFAVVNSIRAGIDRKMFGDYILSFLQNKTDIPFVLPVKGVYSIKTKDIDIIILPVQPKFAVLLIHRDYVHKIVSNGLINIALMDNEEQIMQCNLIAFAAQCKQNWGRVVSANKQLLNNLREEYHKIRFQN